MGAAALRLLCFAVSFAPLAAAQTAFPPQPEKAAEIAGNALRSRALAALPLNSSRIARATTGQNGYPSAIAQDASPAASFAGFYSAPFYPSISSSSGGYALLTGDFNHDGKLDLLSLTFDAVAVLLNDGTGGFGNPIVTQISLNTEEEPSDSPVAYAVDLNGDGYTDLVIAGYTEAPPFEVAVLLNHKDGTFPTITYLPLQSVGPVIYAGSFSGPTGTVAAGKTTANGGIDLVSVQSFTPETTGAQTTILVETLLNDGAGNFPTQKTSSYTVFVPSVLLTTPMATLADVNQDGKLDLLLARNGSVIAGNDNPMLYVDVLLGNGDGTFQPPGANGTILIPGTGESFFSNYLLTANLTPGSLIPDILVTGDSGVYIAKGNGDGTFQAATQFLDYSLPSIQIADLNSDGKLDLVVDSTSGVTTFLGNGDATFGGIAGTAVSGNPGTIVQQFVVADFNGDGKEDFAAVDVGGDVEVAAGNGDGTFHATPLLYSANNPVLNPGQISFQVAGDILGNGTAELVGIGNYAFISASPNGKGGLNYLAALPSTQANSGVDLFPVTGDFNGDGKQDIIVNQPFQGVSVALSKGDGTFATPVFVPGTVEQSCNFVSVAVGDVNGDGKLDLLLAYPGDLACDSYTNTPSGYMVALGNGDGTFKMAALTASGDLLVGVALARYHGPGKPLDMLTSDEGIPPGGYLPTNPSVSILTGNGDGTFGAPVIVSNISSQLLTDDYNQDGKADLTLFGGSEEDPTGGVMLYAGNGDGTFAAPVTISLIDGADEGVYGDVNNDGVPDLIFGGYPYLSVALGTGGGSFATPINYFGLSGGVLAGNFLGDNAQSIISGSAFFMNQGGTILSVVPNPTTVMSGQNLEINVPLQATVRDQPAPTGTIALYDGSTLLNSGPVSGFSFSSTQLAVGNHSIKATYSGDSHFYSNTSPAVSISVTAVPPDFTLSASPATVIVSPGQAATYEIAVAANATLAGTVTFQCSGLPSQATCTFSPSSVTLAAGQAGGVALAISTQSATTAQTSPGGYSFFAGSAIAALLFFVIPRPRRKPFWPLLLVCTVLAPFLGCGGASRNTSPAGTSTVTVTANAMAGTTTITHTSAITLVVQ